MRLPSVGEVFCNRYRLDSVLGEGGFATVFRAQDMTNGMDVAIKVLRPLDGGYPGTSAARFVREAQALSALRDPHTIQLFDCGEAPNGLLFMVFELLGGEDLSDLMARGPIDEATTVHVLRQLLRSLGEAHAAGILHRDIKPGNIRVFEANGDPYRVKLMDFGITRPMGPDVTKLTKTGHMIGTLRYMPLEQMIGDTMSPASDLYSLGIVAYEMLHGTRIPREVVMSNQPIPVRGSPQIGVVLNAMLQAHQHQRVQSASEVERLLSGGQVATAVEPSRALADRSGTAEPSARGALVWAFAISAIIITGTAGYFLTQSEDELPQDRARTVLRMPPAATPAPSTRDDVPIEDAGRSEADVASDVPPTCGTSRRTGSFTAHSLPSLPPQSWPTFVPSSYDGHTPHPMIMFLHGGGMAASEGLQRTRLVSFAEENGVIVVAPDAGALRGWTSAAPLEIFRAVRETMESDYCIDPDRVFVQAHDTGGLPAISLMCEPWVKAAATTSFRRESSEFPCDRPVPYIVFSPTESGHLPLKGGKTCTNNPVRPLASYEKDWRKRNGCKGRAKTDSLKHGECKSWSCDTPFTSCVAEGGWGWPGTPGRAIDLFGCDGQPTSFDYQAKIWEFFSDTTETEEPPPAPK